MHTWVFTTIQMNDDVALGTPSCKEDQQKLLHDAREKQDAFAQEKARVESLLSLTLEKVKVYQALLGATESKLCTVEDLIGNIRFRLRQRGIPTNYIVGTSLSPAPSEVAAGIAGETTQGNLNFERPPS